MNREPLVVGNWDGGEKRSLYGGSPTSMSEPARKEESRGARYSPAGGGIQSGGDEGGPGKLTYNIIRVVRPMQRGMTIGSDRGLGEKTGIGKRGVTEKASMDI